MAKAKINKALAKLTVPISSVTVDPDNERRHSTKNLEAIAASLKQFGQQTPIVVSSAGVVKKGNGTVAAARDILGWKKIAALTFDSDDPDLLRLYGVTDNRTGELATWHLPGLQASLALAKAVPEFDLGALGWSEDDLQPILAAVFKPAAVSDEAIIAGQNIRCTVEEHRIIEDACHKARRVAGDKTMTLPGALVVICQMYLDQTSA